MMSKRAYTATAADGSTHTRRSTREYTHAVIVAGHPRFGTRLNSMHGSETAAIKAARSLAAYPTYYEAPILDLFVEVVPVTQDEGV